MTVSCLTVGVFQENCYIIYDNKEMQAPRKALLIDPGDEGDRIADYLTKNNLIIDKILLTHAHIDHIAAIEFLCGTYSAEVLLHQDDLWLYEGIDFQATFFGLASVKLPSVKSFLEDNSEISFSNSIIRVIHTPGHTPGSVCYHFPSENILLTGDTLFKGSVGRCDLPGGDSSKLLESIKYRLFSLPPQTVIYPGHMSQSTIGDEAQNNPYVNMLS